MFQKLKNRIAAKLYLIFPMLTLLCLAGFIGSLVFPDTALDTYLVNMTEEEGDEQVLLSLAYPNHISYEMNTNGLPMRGIQVGINKQGLSLTGTLHYDVYVISDTGEKTLVSENLYGLSQGDDLQYVYLPYQNYESCAGKLLIDFYAQEDENGLYPALMANHTVIQGTITRAAQEQDCGLKCSYIYTHKTYPLLYDFRILTFIFLAVTMAVQYPKQKSRKGEKHE